jgi:hypothetical protein
MLNGAEVILELLRTQGTDCIFASFTDRRDGALVGGRSPIDGERAVAEEKPR